MCHCTNVSLYECISVSMFHFASVLSFSFIFKNSKLQSIKKHRVNIFCSTIKLIQDQASVPFPLISGINKSHQRQIKYF